MTKYGVMVLWEAGARMEPEVFDTKQEAVDFTYQKRWTGLHGEGRVERPPVAAVEITGAFL